MAAETIVQLVRKVLKNFGARLENRWYLWLTRRKIRKMLGDRII